MAVPPLAVGDCQTQGELFAHGLPVPGDSDAAVRVDFGNSIGVVFRAGAFNQRLQRIIVNSRNVAVAP